MVVADVDFVSGVDEIGFVTVAVVVVLLNLGAGLKLRYQITVKFVDLQKAVG